MEIDREYIEEAIWESKRLDTFIEKYLPDCTNKSERDNRKDLSNLSEGQIINFFKDVNLINY